MNADQNITLSEAIALISTNTKTIEGENEGESVTVGAYDYVVEPEEGITAEPIETSIPEVCVVSTEAGYDPTIAELFS